MPRRRLSWALAKDGASREQNKNAIKRDKAELAQSLASVSILFKIINVVFLFFMPRHLTNKAPPLESGAP